MTPEQIQAEIERLRALLPNDAIEPKRRGAQSESVEAIEGETIGGEKNTGSGIIVSTISEPQSLPQPSSSQNPSFIVESGSRRSIAHANEHEIRREMTAELCKRVAEGASLNKLCKEAGNPSMGTFLRWCHDDAEIGQMYVVALRLRAAGHAEDLLEDMEELEKATDQTRVSALKVKINTRQWIMSRLLPKQYGDHQIIEHTGEVKLDEKQIDARLNHLVKRIKGTVDQ